MQEQHLFEYAVIRVAPRVEREEFMNVGVVLYCRSRQFLQALMHIDEARLCAFAPRTGPAEIGAYLRAFEHICTGNPDCGSPVALWPLADRFRWLTATRSTVVQTSKVHPGLCTSPAETLLKLYSSLVLP